MKKLFEKIKEAYWACRTCNREAGGVWPEGHCATVTSGDCAVCGAVDVTLIPWVDYDWKNVNTEGLRD